MNSTYKQTSQQLICAVCDQQTDEDNSKVYELFYGEGSVEERQCSDCTSSKEQK